MIKKVKVGISNRHIHLTEEVYNSLFATPLTKKKDLSQLGEFASNQVVTLKTEKGKIENVRVIGPLRNYNQVEISASDARVLGICPPVRKSGDLKNSEAVFLVGEKGEVFLKDVCILSEKHIHLNEKEAMEWGVSNGEVVPVKIKGDRSGIVDAHIKISENGVRDFHIDTDEANAFLLKQDDEVEILLY